MIRQIKNLFARNWGLKLFSLIVAVILWLTLMPEERTFSEKTLTIALETHNIPPEMELVEKPPSAIDVTIRAPNRLLSQITSSNISAMLNLRNATITQEDYPLYPSMISVPPGAEVIRILPSRVKLKLEQTKEISLKITPNIIGHIGDAYSIDKVEVTPANVSVSGPQSKIRETDVVRTTPIDVSDLTESTNIEAELILPRPELRLTFPQTRVRVRIIVSAKKPQG
jgi:YbbR domain-containing protein